VCLTLFATLALIDGPIPAGDLAGLIACATLLGGSYLATVMAAQQAEELGKAVDTLTNHCVSPLEWMYTLPEAPGKPKPDPVPEPKPIPFPYIPGSPPSTPKPKFILYHYSSEVGVAGILATQAIYPSLADDKRAAFGHGQYFTDISPADASIGSAYQLSRALYTVFWDDWRVKSFVAINVFGLPIEQVREVYSHTYGEHYIYLHRSETPLPITGRIELSGIVNFAR
jgi:hypothetical protein